MSFLDNVKTILAEKQKLYANIEPNKPQQEILIEALETINYNAPAVRKEIDEYVYDWMENKIPNHQLPQEEDLIIIHYTLAKSSLAEQGLDNVKLIIRDRQKGEDAGAFYSDKDKSITLYTEIFKDPKWKDPIQFHHQHETLAFNLYKIEHEIRHAVQWKNFYEANKSDIQTMPVSNYLMQKQNMTRSLFNNVYNPNWGKFRIEIDADYNGGERALYRLNKIAPSYHKYTEDTTYVKYVVGKRSNELANMQNITWQHNTNVNNNEVQADLKASMMITYGLSKMSSSQRAEFFKAHPLLNLSYNANGTKKSLDQIEQERDEKIKEILSSNKEDNEANQEATAVSDLYDAVIESDPILSFEFQLRHIANISYGKERYFTKNGHEVKYSSALIHQEIAEAAKKCKDLAPILESVDAKTAQQLFNKYNKIVEGIKFGSDVGFRFKQEKLSLFKEIQLELNKNQIIYQTIQKDKEIAEKIATNKKATEEKALEILNKVFPNFNPSKSYNLSTNQEGYFSKEEKALLLASHRKYVKDKTIANDKDGISTSEVLGAINRLYQFSLTPEDDELYQDITPLPNIYSKEDETESDDSDARSKEIKPTNKPPLNDKQQKAKQIIKKAFPNFNPIDYSAQEKMLLQRSMIMLNDYMIQNDLQTWQDDYTIEHLVEALNILYTVEISEEQQNDFDKQLFAQKVKLEKHLLQEDEKELDNQTTQKQEQSEEQKKEQGDEHVIQ